jgi:hypothetical protein
VSYTQEAPEQAISGEKMPVADMLRALRRGDVIDIDDPGIGDDDTDPCAIEPEEFNPADFADWQDTDTCPPGECPYDNSADYQDA